MYSYRTEDTILKVGDVVKVPVGKDDGIGYATMKKSYIVKNGCIPSQRQLFSNALVFANVNFIIFALHCFFVKYDDIRKTTKSSIAHITMTFEDLLVLVHCIKFVILSNIKTPYLIQNLKR